MSLDTLTDLQLLYDMSMKPATLVQKTETREKYYTLVTDPLLKLIFEIVTVVKFTTTPHLNELSIDVEEQSSSCLSSDCTVSEATAFKEESATDQEIKALEKREKPRKKLSKFGFSQLNLLVPELTLNSNTRLVLTEKKKVRQLKKCLRLLLTLPDPQDIIAPPGCLNSLGEEEPFLKKHHPWQEVQGPTGLQQLKHPGLFPMTFPHQGILTSFLIQKKESLQKMNCLIIMNQRVISSSSF